MAAAEILTDLSRATDSNSAPLSGALFYFYASGGLTPLAVYTTAALTVEHANPVVADSAGLFDPIYFDSSSQYRGVLKDASGNTIRDIDPINAGIMGQLAGSGGAALLGFLQAGSGTVARTMQAKAREIEVSITDYTGGTADGTTDNTAALQAAVTALSNGGVIKIPRSASAYRIDLVNITVANITVRLEPGATIKKYGNAGVAKRGVFKVANLLNANFTLDLNGGTIDLNGEGPTGIGIAGRIENTYGAQTVASIVCCSGPANAAVYGLRASGIKVRGPGKIKNTGETALLFRNCGGTSVQGVDFENVANYGVEFNIVLPASDSGTGTMPERGSCEVNDCSFTDFRDFGLGSGNGVGIGVGGAGSQGALRHYRFRRNNFLRCHRDIHVEFLTGTYIEGFDIDGVDSEDCGQSSLGLVGMRHGNVDNVSIINPGHASAVALFYQVTEAASPGNGSYPESAAITLSTDWEDVTLGDNIVITDKRAGGVVYLADGVAVAGDATFTSAGATFTADDVGKPIGIIGAGPSAVVHETYIAAYNSATSIELEAAPVTSISSAKFAYGGGVRNGISLYAGTSASIGEVTIEGGSQFGLTNEPATAAAIFVRDATGVVKIGKARLESGSNGTSHPCAIRMADTGLDASVASTFTGKLVRGQYYASGFTMNEIGTYTRRASTIGMLVNSSADQAIAPSATADTYGTQESRVPTAAFFTTLLHGSFETAGTVGGGETVTYRLTANYFDSGSSSITVTATATGTTQLTAKNLVALNPDGVPIRSLVFDMKSTAAASAATGKVNLTALQA